MSRKFAFSPAYSHEAALGRQMAQAFVAPQGIPAGMQAVLDLIATAQLDRVGAIKILTEAEAGCGQAASQAR